MDLSMGKVLLLGLTNLVLGEWWPCCFTWTSGSLASPTPNSNLCLFIRSCLVFVHNLSNSFSFLLYFQRLFGADFGCNVIVACQLFLSRTPCGTALNGG